MHKTVMYWLWNWRLFSLIPSPSVCHLQYPQQLGLATVTMIPNNFSCNINYCMSQVIFCISSRRCTLYWSVHLGPILWYTRTYEHDYKRDSPLKLWLKYLACCQNIGKLLKVFLLWILAWHTMYSLQYASKTSLSNSIIWWEGKGGTSLFFYFNMYPLLPPTTLPLFQHAKSSQTICCLLTNSIANRLVYQHTVAQAHRDNTACTQDSQMNL